jgi:ribosomal protein S27AE
MANDDMVRTLDRRNFLRGSSLFAAALGLGVTPTLAQQQPPQAKPADKPKEPKEKAKEKEQPEDPFAEGEKPKSKDGKLYDKEGREYRICPQCGYNMYKQGRMWICENCGYSYVE